MKESRRPVCFVLLRRKKIIFIDWKSKLNILAMGGIKREVVCHGSELYHGYLNKAKNKSRTRLTERTDMSTTYFSDSTAYKYSKIL